MKKPRPSAPAVCNNRVFALMAHTSRYCFRGTSRLAQDSGVAKSTISEIIRGIASPRYKTIAPIIKSLGFQLARKLNVREVFSEDGTFPTKYVCKLVGCRGCLPDSIHDSEGGIKPQWANVRSGQWTGDVAEFEATAG